MNLSKMTSSIQSVIDRYGMYLAAAIALCAAGWLGYGYYSRWSARKSFTHLSEGVDAYSSLQRSSASSDAWKDAQVGFAARTQENNRSALAPYFLAMQADALLKEGNREGARDLYAQLLKQLPKEAPLYSLYVIKNALIAVDSEQQAERVAGLKQLEALAQDKQSVVQDMALYYLGYNAWVQHDVATSEKYFKELIELYPDAVWTSMAKDKMSASA